MKLRAVLSVVAVCLLWGCDSCADKPPPPTTVASAPQPVADAIVQAEASATERAAGRPACLQPTHLYDGSIRVAATGYVHQVERGGEVVEEPIIGLDRVVSKEPQIRFTLDYPFEKPFAGVVTGKISVRRIIDAIRAGFRAMYEGATQKDIPGMFNKEVRGSYGKSFHAIEDLVIESIELCSDGSLEISIGS